MAANPAYPPDAGRVLLPLARSAIAAQLGVNVSAYGLLLVALLLLRLGPARNDSSQTATDGDNHEQ